MPTLESRILPAGDVKLRSKPPLSITPNIFQALADLCAIVFSVVVYGFLKFNSGWFETSMPAASTSNPFLLFLSALGMAIYWLVLFWFFGLYKNWYVRSPFDEMFSVFKVTFLGCGVLLVLIFWSDDWQQASNSRLIIFLYWLMVSFAVVSGRFAVRSVQRRLRERGLIRIPAILIGCADKLRQLIRSIDNAPGLGYLPVGVLLRDKDEYLRWQEGSGAAASTSLPVLGVFDDLGTVLDSVRPQEALVSIDKPNHENLLGISALCATKNVTVKIIPDLYEIFSGQARTMQIYGTPLIEVSPRLMKPWEEVAKRLLDILVSFLVLLLGLPVWIVVALIIKLDTPGPVFFAQERVGRDGRHFTLFKFRSMFVDAERHGPQWATVNDPRVSRVGRFIRKTHIDEIPQFFNVLKGQMSMVGPRPERPYYVEKFTEAIPYYPRRLKVRPGITGWHQVKYITYDETLDDVRDRLRYDFFYIENMSFKLDLEILVRTVFRVLKGHGQA